MLLLVTLLFKIAPKHSGDVLCSVPERKAAMCLVQKMCGLDELLLDMSEL